MFCNWYCRNCFVFRFCHALADDSACDCPRRRSAAVWNLARSFLKHVLRRTYPIAVGLYMCATIGYFIIRNLGRFYSPCRDVLRFPRELRNAFIYVLIQSITIGVGRDVCKDGCWVRSFIANFFQIQYCTNKCVYFITIINISHFDLKFDI